MKPIKSLTKPNRVLARLRSLCKKRARGKTHFTSDEQEERLRMAAGAHARRSMQGQR